MQVDQLKGVESFDVNDMMFFVQAPIEFVAKAFSQLYDGRLQCNVYGRELSDAVTGFILMQFLRHSWTIVYRPEFPFYSECEKDAQKLSRLLITRAVYYYITDTGGELTYKLYQNGNCVEKLKWDYGDGGSIQFQSQLRSEIRDIGTFFEEQNIYVPVLYFKMKLEPTVRGFIVRLYKSVTLEPTDSALEKPVLIIPKFERSDFERVDYFAVD